MARRIAIVGAGLAGLRSAEQVRAAGWEGEVVVIGAEPHMPYNRPPLSKPLPADAGTPELLESLSFARSQSLADVEWSLGAAVADADLEAGRLRLDDGSEVRFDGLVVATGVSPRRLPLDHIGRGRHVLRTVSDAVAIRDALAAGRRAVIVGAGFIGCELAATARQLGREVTVVEGLGQPMEAAIGPRMGSMLRGLHERHGVAIHTRRTLRTAVAGAGGEIVAVELDDGQRLPCDVLVEAVGSQPNIAWLGGNDLDLDNGVVCDNWLNVLGHPRVVAAGDVARFPTPGTESQPRRFEHWYWAGETARRAGASLVAALRGESPDPKPFAPVPAFWSEQFGVRIEAIGEFSSESEYVFLDGDSERPERGVIAAANEGGQLVGALAVGLPPTALLPYRRALADRPVVLPPTPPRGAG